MKEQGLERERILRYLKGNYSLEDSKYFKDILSDDQAETYLRNILKDHWDELFSDKSHRVESLDHILYKIHYEINNRAKKQKGILGNFFKWSVRISALIFLPVILIMLFHIYQNTLDIEEITFIEYNSPAWTRTRFSLPDGTKGWLNSNSSLSYSSHFINDRQVFLTGEALFDISSDKEKPFSVITGEARLIATGTTFNVTSYENEDYIEIVLDEGKLLFSNNEMDISYNMSPNDKVLYDKNMRDLSLEIVNPMKYTAWTEGMLVFRNDPIDVVAKRLERWYNIDVEVSANVSNEIQLRATFIDESLEEVLDLLSKTINIDYKITERDIGEGNIYSRRKVLIVIET